MYDVIILGGGPGGYPAAIKASKNGLKVALVECDNFGGVCLNWGCIPTKALLHAAEKYYFIKNEAASMGINVGDLKFDFKKVVEYSEQKIKKLSSGISYLMKKHKIDIFNEYGRLRGVGKIQLADSKKVLEGKNIIIATGSHARVLKGLEFDHKLIWDCRDAMRSPICPDSLLIIGSGAIGMEFASIYNAFGVRVTVVEMQNRILPTEDEEISKLAEKEFKKAGISIITSAMVSGVNKKDDSVVVKLNNGKNIEASRILVAAGVEANSSDIGLDSVSKIKTKNGFICVDNFYSTGEKNIYAIGDVVGPPCLAHKAIYESSLCIDRILGKYVVPIDPNNIPGCIYSLPSIASVGLSEETAIKQGYKVKIGRVKGEGNGKSVVLSKESGFVKTIFDSSTGELLGAHMVGGEVTEMINGYLIAKSLEATSESMKSVIFPHPTVSEMMYEAILAADGEEIHG